MEGGTGGYIIILYIEGGPTPALPEREGDGGKRKTEN